MAYTLPLEEFVAKFEESVARLEHFGLRIGSTRIARYLKVLRSAIVAERKDNIAHQRHPSFVNALIEASEFIDIAAMHDVHLSSPRAQEKLTRISSGPEVMSPIGHDPARDYAFELSTAARADANDLFSGFPETGDLIVGGPATPVECKRLSSVAQFDRRLREARNQLAARVGSGELPGVIAMDLTRPIRVAHPLIDAQNEDELVRIASDQLTAFIARHLAPESTMEGIRVPSVLGVCVRYLAAGTAGDAGHIRRAIDWQMISVHEEDSAENGAFLESMKFLGPEPFNEISNEKIEAALAAIESSSRNGA